MSDKKKRFRPRIGIKQVNIEVPDEFHEKIRVRSAEQNKTLKNWVSEAIQEKFKREEELGWK